MSLQINERKITGVLLADGWHKCVNFGLDDYELGVYYQDHDWGRNGSPRFRCHHGGGDPEVCATGFAFTDPDSGVQLAGPLTAVLAVAGPGITSDPAPGDPSIGGGVPTLGSTP